MTNFVPKFTEGPITLRASAAVTGGALVKVSGNQTVAPATATDYVLGTAGFDAKTGEDVTVWLRGKGVHGLVASASISAGSAVKAAAGGKVATTDIQVEADDVPVQAPGVIGVALNDATADEIVFVAL
jgi:hypothetical protein